MSKPSKNSNWIIEAGDAVIQKKARSGIGSLSSLERLIYCLWVADYGMTNAGDLGAAHDLYSGFQIEAVRFSKELGLQKTHAAFALPTEALQSQYFDLLDDICREIISS